MIKNTSEKLSLREKLRKGQKVIGTWCEIPSPEVVNILAKAGLDFVIIDMEHGAADFRTAARMVVAAQAEGCAPLIRVAGNDDQSILRALEAAPEGVIVPHIETTSQREKAMSHIKFSPDGTRSLNPFTRAGSYGSNTQSLAVRNREIFSGLIIESMAGVKNMEKILGDNSIDIIYIGTYDLSVDLGLAGQTKHPKVLALVKKLTKTTRAKNVNVGCIFGDEKELKYLAGLGVNFLCYRADSGVIFDNFSWAKNLL